MRRWLFALGALAALPLLACGAAPEGTPGDASDELGTAADALNPGKAIAATTIGFDADPDGNLIHDNENVSSLYWEKVTFWCVGCGDQVYARSPGRTANGVSIRNASPPNYVEPGFSEYMGVVQATLTRPASCVSVDTFALAPEGPDPFFPITGAPWLEAYDANGNKLLNWSTGTDRQTADGTLGQWETLGICTGSYDIASVRFSSSSVKAGANGVLGRFDNLYFDSAPIVKQPPLQPPPPIQPPPRLP
jgi:hypothetical protein